MYCNRGDADVGGDGGWRVVVEVVTIFDDVGWWLVLLVAVVVVSVAELLTDAWRARVSLSPPHTPHTCGAPPHSGEHAVALCATNAVLAWYAFHRVQDHIHFFSWFSGVLADLLPAF